MVKGKLARGAFCITGRPDQSELSRAWQRHRCNRSRGFSRRQTVHLN